MIIDFHTHIFPDEIAGKTLEKLRKMGGISPFTDGTLNGLKASMKAAGVDISLILPDVVRCTPGRVENLLNQTSPEKLVLAHMGGIKYWNQVENRLIGKNLYLDTGFALGEMEDEQFLRMTRSHGADKVLFATDSPWKEQKQMVAHMKELGLEKEELELISYKNAQGLLGL